MKALVREGRATLALAVPMMAGQVGQMLLGLCDSLMVGRLGVVPLAASAFANGIISVLFVAGIGLLASISVLASQAHGAGRPREAGETLRHGLALAAAAGLAMAGAVWLGGGVFRFFGQPPEVVAEARAFMILMGWSLVPALAGQGLKQFCEALSRPWAPMMLTMAVVALNVFLSWVFIYGHLGSSALGLTGAGWATLLARCAMTAALGGFVLGSRHFRDALPARWLAALSAARLRALLRIGLPVATQLLLEVTAFACAALMMGWLGAAALAAHQIAITCAATTFMFPLGLSLAVSVRVGQAVGAGERERVRAIGLGGVGLAVAIMGVFAVGFLLAGRVVARGFVADEAVVAMAVQLLAVVGLFQVFDGAQVVSAGALRGLSDVRAPTGIAFVAYWVIALPLSYLGGFGWGFGAVGIWTGLALGLAFAAVVLTGRLRARTAVGGAPPRGPGSPRRAAGELAAAGER